MADITGAKSPGSSLARSSRPRRPLLAGVLGAALTAGLSGWLVGVLSSGAAARIVAPSRADLARDMPGGYYTAWIVDRSDAAAELRAAFAAHHSPIGVRSVPASPELVGQIVGPSLEQAAGRGLFPSRPRARREGCRRRAASASPCRSTSVVARSSPSVWRRSSGSCSA
ncbi:MAG TPA: hypothetical protein VMD59_01990 [Acidimicrobiales bacterium]|nr:hypothetical protein [Acidimicrobiales bacterium]